MYYKINKVKIKDRTLTVDMDETISNENGQVTNEVTKKCAYLAHEDLLLAFKAMIPHLVKICDFKGADNISENNIADFEAFPEYHITGISIGGNCEYEGITIIAQREFPSGKVLNIVTPFQQFQDVDYPFNEELQLAVEACIHETNEYLFNDKFAVKQLEMDFGGMDEEPANAQDAVDKLIKPLKEKIKKYKEKKKIEVEAEVA